MIYKLDDYRKTPRKAVAWERAIIAAQRAESTTEAREALRIAGIRLPSFDTTGE